jgi:hypothetical protein
LEETELDNLDLLLTDFEDLIMFRYKLDGERVREIDAKYLPPIYEAIASRYPNLKDYLLKSFKAAGVDLSLFQKTAV